MKRKAFLAIPTLTGELKAATEVTVQVIRTEAESLGFGFQEFRLMGDSIITHARNTILAHFLKSDATELFCLDADVAFGPGVFARLMSHRVHFVAAVYRVKQNDERYPVLWPDGDLRIDDRTGLVEAKAVPMGCARISRQAIERMVAANQDEWFECSYQPKLKCPNLFRCEVENHQVIGEDYYFCKKWRETGSKVWVDVNIPIVHVGLDRLPDGSTQDRNFPGHLAKYLELE